MSNIHNYPLTATVINDEDYYDVDFWNGLTYETRKISGATLKALLGGGAEELNDLTDVTTDLPVSPTNADDGRILYFDVDTGQWISDDIANIANVVKDCKTSALTGTIPKGTAVYLAGYDNDLLVVEPCDNTDPNKMPCIGVTAEVLDDTNAKKVVSFGKLQGMDTSAFLDGDELYVGTGGGFVTTRPTGSVEIQRVAVVLKSDATGGQIKVFNTSRTAGLPNLSQDNLWVGDANGHPVETPLASLPSVNIYNADGTLTGNRIVDIDTFGLAFQIGGFTLVRMINPPLPEVIIGGLTTPTNYDILQVRGLTNTIGVKTDNSNGFWFQCTDGIHPLNLNGTLTTNRNQTFQDADGTIALLSDIPSLVNIFNSDGTLTGNRVVDRDGNNLSIDDLTNAAASYAYITSFSAEIGRRLSLAAGDKNSIYAAPTLICIAVANAGIPVTIQADLIEFENKTNGGKAVMDTSLITGLNKTHTWQDKDGVIAHLSDIPASSAEKHIDTFYAYDMSPSPGFTWNGVLVASSALTTVGALNGVRFQQFSGTGQPDGCYVNTACPLYYNNGDDINLNLTFSTNGTGGDVKIFVGIQTPNAGVYGDDTTTTWLSYTWTAAAGYPIEKATIPFGGVGLNLNAGDPIVIKIYRDPADGADTYNGDAWVNTLGVEIG